MNQIKCSNVFLQKDEEYEVSFRLSLFNFEPSRFTTELRIGHGIYKGDIYNYEALHDVVLADSKEGNQGFFPKTGLPRYPKRQFTVDNVGGNFGEIDPNFNTDKKWIPWIRPQITGNKQYWFRFKTTTKSYSSGAWMVSIYTPKGIGNLISSAFIVEKSWDNSSGTDPDQSVIITPEPAKAN